MSNQLIYKGAQIQLKSNPYLSNTQMHPSQLGYFTSTTNQQKNNSFFNNNNSKLIFENVAIVSKKANKVLDVCQDKQTKGMLIIYEDYKQLNQRFDIVQMGDSVNIISRQTGKYLTVAANSQNNGAPIFEQPSSGMVGQRFRLAHLENNQYFIHTFCGKVLDCCEEKTSNGTRVIQFRCQRTQHQKWLIK